VTLVPQGLKPNLFLDLLRDPLAASLAQGRVRAEVVPFPIDMIASFLNPYLMLRLWRRGIWGEFV
jgi:hypothetical protein